MIRTSCMRYDVETGHCKLTHSPAKCSYDCFGYTYIPDCFEELRFKFWDTHKPGFNDEFYERDPWEPTVSFFKD